MTVMGKIEFKAHIKPRLLRGFVRNRQLYPGGAESAPPRLDRVKIGTFYFEKLEVVFNLKHKLKFFIYKIN
jgi:hypothetical protein